MLRLASLQMLLLMTTAASPAADQQTAPPEPGGMQKLFNGTDLSGWDGDPRLWSVSDGVIRGATTKENPAQGNTFLIWQGGTPSDFDLRLSFRCSTAVNSGIQYRSRHITGDSAKNKWVARGYQHEVRNSTELPSVSGFIYDEGGTRKRMCLVGEEVTWDADGRHLVRSDLIDQAGYEKLFHLDGWNEAVIIARGNHIQHYLNGKLIVDFTDNHPTLALSEGILALQLHQGEPMWTEFKDVRLKMLK